MVSNLNILLEIEGFGSSVSEKYSALSSLFHRVINTATSKAVTDIELHGPFAKTEYLLKEKNAKGSMRKKVHTARVNFRRLATTSLPEKKENYPYDLEAVAEFIALLENQPLPEKLTQAFPSTPRYNVKRELLSDYIRVMVEKVDDHYIYGSSELNPTAPLTIDYISPNKAFPFDWSYLKNILRVGSQINLIRPRRDDDDVIYPELIIFEPDLLIDVSGVAGCFESYTTDARIAMLKRISPAPMGDAINLGNFASQFLDEEIHSSSPTPDYLQSVKTFFKNNALTLAALPPKKEFHADARAQHAHIREALHRALPSSFSGFNLKEVMVEPSFFSEMLGLQGRMDFLQLDLRILAEQKSGKGEWPHGNYITPRHRTPHYVQLLLYMLIVRYNYRHKYEANSYRLDAFLLYSKYEKSLLSLGFAPELVFEAIKIRNMIAAGDIANAEEGVEYLTKLRPETLLSGSPTPLWNRFTLPQLSSLLSPLHVVENLDRLYYLRMMRFTAKEHLLSKIGNQKKENSGFASTWLSGTEEKIESGNIYTSLRLDPAFPSSGKIEEVRLLFQDEERNAMANFRIGDVVILYSYPEGEEPDARKTMVFRGTITELSSTSIVVRLRSPQSSSLPFHRSLHPSSAFLLWAIEHDFMESSFTGLYRSLHSFLSAPAPRRDLLMFRRAPRIDRTLGLTLNHGAFNTLALHARQARDLFLIVGPPGTGKTSFGLMTSIREELASTDGNILVMAYTNRAVDEICSKLFDEGIEYIRLGNEFSCSSSPDKLLSRRIENCGSVTEVKGVIERTRVIVSTTTALNASPALFLLKQFSLAVIDEASQILEPHIIGLLSAVSPQGVPAIGRFIMTGDHKQLPAVVQQREQDSIVSEPELNAIDLTDCALSLFERLIKRYGDNPEICYMLTAQGRMHRDIADFPNNAFYGGKLRVVPLPHQEAPLPVSKPEGNKTSLQDIISGNRMAFIDIATDKHGGSDKVNLAEATLIARMVKEIWRENKGVFDPDRTVGVIVPYRNQIAAIRNELERFNIPRLTDITIDTIERYQGSQRKYIIYGFTVSREYQLDFLSNQTFEENGALIDRKLNVAMTRAEEHLLMVGNAPLLKSNPVFSDLLSYLEERQAVFKASAATGV